MISLWTVWKISQSALECLLLYYVLAHYLPRKASAVWPSLAGLAGLCIAKTAAAAVSFSYLQSIGLDFALCTAYCLLFFGGKTSVRLLWTAVWTACRALTLAAAVILLSSVPDSSPEIAALPTPEGMGTQAFCLAALGILAWGIVRFPVRSPRKWAGRIHLAALGALALGILSCAQIASVGFSEQVPSAAWQSLRILALCIGGMMVLCAAVLDAGGRLAWTKDAAFEDAQASRRELDSVRHAGDMIRTWQHDFGQMLAVMRTLAAQGDLAALEKYLGNVHSVYEEDLLGAATGDAGIDAVLRMKIEQARSEGIPVSCTIGQIGTWCRLRAELSVIIGNLLDNAIEACRQMEAQEPRFITLLIAAAPDGLVIRVINSSTGTYLPDGQKLQSTKQSPGHGYGFRRVERQIRRVGGSLRLRPGEDRFEASVYFPPLPADAEDLRPGAYVTQENAEER